MNHQPAHAFNQADNSCEEASKSLPSKTRAEFIDIARVIAALIILLVHASYTDSTSQGLFSMLFFKGRIAFFFIIAGFFLKDSSLRGVLRRLKLLIIPYLIWECIPLFALTLNGVNLLHVSGMSPSTPSIEPSLSMGSFFELISSKPLNYPLWFLRDLMLYMLISPLILPFKRYAILVGLGILALYSCGVFPIDCDGMEFLNRKLKGFGFFLFGMGLQVLSLERITAFFARYHLPILLLTAFVHLGVYLQFPFVGVIDFPPSMALLGVIGLLAFSMTLWIHLPRLSRLCLWAAPATYLIFLSHTMSYALLASLIIDQLGMAFFQHYNLCINMGLTLIIIIGAAALVKLLRIWAPGLLPSIAGIRK